MPDVDSLRPRIIEDYRDLFRAGEVLHFAVSFGKDSNVILNLGMEAALQHREAGEVVPPMLVVHADTGVENPAVRQHAQGMAEALRDFAQREQLDIRVRIVGPSLLDEMPVQVVSGRTLPVFASRSDRACTTDWKIRPAQRAIRELRSELAAEGYTGMPITVLGTRREESSGRAARMDARGEGTHVNEVRDEQGALKSRTFAPIAGWEQEQVWEYLILAGSRGGPYRAYAPSFDETLEIYRDASDECTLAPGEGGSKSPCGARHGCWACTVAGNEDKSMRHMLEKPRYRHMRRLGDLRNWMVATQHDYSIRRWVTRSTDPDTGYTRISPEAYSPETTRWLLAVMLSIDVEERERAARLRELVKEGREGEDPGVQEIRAGGRPGLPIIERQVQKYLERMQVPQFQVISPEALIAIDYRWSMDAAHPPHEALRVWHEVVREGKRVFAPEHTFPVPRVPMPKPRWHRGPEDAEPPYGALGPMVEMFSEGCPALYEYRTRTEQQVRPDGKQVCRQLLDLDRVVGAREAERFDIDEESLELFWQFELEGRLEVNARFHAGEWVSRTEAAGWYLRYGLVGLAQGRARDAERQIIRGRAWERAGLSGGVTLEQIQADTISDDEHKVLVQQARKRAEAEQAEGAARVERRRRAVLRRAPELTPEQADRLLAARARMKTEWPRMAARMVAIQAAQELGMRRIEGEPVEQVRKRYATALNDWAQFVEQEGPLRPYLAGLYRRLQARVEARAARVLEIGEPSARQFEWGFGIGMPFDVAAERAAEHARKARALDAREASRWLPEAAVPVVLRNEADEQSGQLDLFEQEAA